jgi:hypothetical protein
VSERPRLVSLDLVAAAEPWRAAGFAVEDGHVRIGTTDLVFSPAGAGAGSGSGLLGWTVAGAIPAAQDGLDGVPTAVSAEPRAPGEATSAAAPPHPNTVTAIDHVVLATPDTVRTFEVLEAAGFTLRRVRDAGPELRQGFFLFADLILEVVGPPEPRPGTAQDRARLWGVTLVASDLPAAARASGASAPREAVQAGRQIAIVPKDAGLGTRVALMSPRT